MSEQLVSSELLRAGILSIVLLAAVAACGGGGGYGGGGGSTPTYTVGGTVSGLTGTGLVLRDNGSDSLPVSSNGAFTFSASIASGGAYAVTVATQPANPSQVCTVAGGSGAVSNANVTSVTVACQNTYTIGGTVSGLTGAGLVLSDNGGDALPVSADGSFTFTTPIKSGSAYAVTVATQPTKPAQFCRVGAGSGTATANVGTVSVTCGTIAQVALVTNRGSGDIYSYVVNSSTGALVPAGGGPVASGTEPGIATLTPDGKYMYVANGGSSTLSGFVVDATTGAVTPVPGSPFAIGAAVPQQIESAAIHPSGKFVYVASGAAASVSAFTINATTGALTAIPGSPFPGRPGAGGGDTPVFDPQGKFFFVPNANDNSVSAYAVDATTGVLTAIVGSPFATGSTPYHVTVTPNGKFAFAVNYGSNNISAFSVDATTGALTPITGSPFTAGVSPLSATIDSTGQHFYVPNTGANTVSVYSVDATTGALLAVGSPAVTGTAPYYLTIDVTGRYAYVPSRLGTDIHGYSIDPTSGALTALSGSPFAAGTGPLWLQIDPSSQFAYVANTSSNNISGYTIDGTTGALVPITGSPFAAGTEPTTVNTVPGLPP